MKKLGWFQRCSGSPVQTVQECECHQYGRDFCFGCVIERIYDEKEPVYMTENVPPVWKQRWLKTHLTPADTRFLLGLPEKKPFIPRRKNRDYSRTRKNFQTQTYMGRQPNSY